MEGSNTSAEQQERDFQSYLFSLLAQSAGSKAHVNAVTILGAKVTLPSFLEYATRKPLQAKTVADVINFSQDTAERLSQLDIFDNVQVLLENASDNDPLAAPDSINVVYKVKEKSRLFIKTGTEVGNNEGNMNGTVTVRNVFGGAELLETVASFGTRTSSAFQTLSRFGYHELSYDCSWRSIDRVLPGASLSIRHEAGHSLKSSISHVFVRERRDDILLPSNGHYVRIANEFAGVLGIGNARFFKSEAESQVCHQFGGGQLLTDKEGKPVGVHPGLVISASARAGFLSEQSDDSKASTVSDRFLLGGPLSVRGFKIAGIGPKDYQDALGGHLYWAAGLSAIAPLPTLESKPLRAHAFINAGTNIPWQRKTSLQSTAEALSRSPSVSVGFGLIYRHSIARIELNYCIPLTAARGDQIRRGLQFGIGLNFL
ncbi:hypothetical protein G6F46_003683 [Rhizopus delemar]|nr:hypothetical protein G6F46_003683 [Rhizopus delemar]